MIGRIRLGFGARFGARRTPERQAAARARRARDHLTKKREQERRRLSRDRARHANRDDRRRRLRVLAPVGFAAALVVGGATARPLYAWLWLDDVPLERVSVLGARVLEPARIAAHAGAIAGTPLAALDPAAIRARLGEEPWIESARVLRLPGGTLVVDVRERAAIARWVRDDGVALVDASGARFAGDPALGGALPRVIGAAPDDDRLPEEALAILRALERHALATPDREVRLRLPAPAPAPTGHDATDAADATDPATRPNADGYVLEIGETGPRALLGRDLFAERIARLAVLLDHEAPEVRDARWIDLRYADRAVLRTEPASG